MRRVYHSRIITFARGALMDYGKAYMVTEDGIIRGIKKRKPQGIMVDYGDFVILPGFVDIHTHLAQMDVRGRWRPDLLEWLERYVFDAEMKFEDVDYAKRKSREFFMELGKNGTTTAAVYGPPYMGATDAAFEAAAESGLRIIMGQTLMDMNAPEEMLTSPEHAVSSVKKLAEKWNGYAGMLYYAVTPRFAVTCTHRLMRMVGDIGREKNLYVQTHICEQEREIEEALKLHPGYESYAAIYLSAGLLGPRSILAHSVHLSPEDLQILRAMDSRIAHCPSSNFFLHSGIMNIRKLKTLGLKIGFGSDVAGGPYFSMLEVARDASYANRLSPEEAFYHITLGGAEALGLSGVTGSLEPGKSADFVVIDAGSVGDADEVLSTLIYLGDDRNIVATYVAGRKVYEREKN